MAIDGEIVSNLPVPGPGRDSKYRPEFNEQARKLCLLGATDDEMADFFDVCRATISNWKSEYPAFLDAIRAGKIAADAEVADSLFRRATGEVAFVERAYKTNEGDYKVVSLRQFIPGDVAAQRLWLLNRRKGDWREKPTPDEIAEAFKEAYGWLPTQPPPSAQE